MSSGIPSSMRQKIERIPPIKWCPEAGEDSTYSFFRGAYYVRDGDYTVTIKKQQDRAMDRELYRVLGREEYRPGKTEYAISVEQENTRIAYQHVGQRLFRSWVERLFERLQASRRKEERRRTQERSAQRNKELAQDPGGKLSDDLLRGFDLMKLLPARDCHDDDGIRSSGFSRGWSDGSRKGAARRCVKCGSYFPMPQCGNCEGGYFEFCRIAGGGDGINCDKCDGGISKWKCAECGCDNPYSKSIVQLYAAE